MEKKNVKPTRKESAIEYYAQWEPRLIWLKNGCIQARNSIPKRYRTEHWYRHLKPLLMDFVGFGATSQNEELHTCETYDAVYSECIEILGL